jgi:hypothetical protein
MIDLPFKLPMIVKPKILNKNTLGGCLLKDDKFIEDLFVERKAYGSTSTITGCNKIYNMVNNISDTPFKINQPLLYYLNGAVTKHNLLMDPLIKHKYADLEKRSRYQERMIATYNSKVLLQ